MIEGVVASRFNQKSKVSSSEADSQEQQKRN
jgi:hypothetical protein